MSAHISDVTWTTLFTEPAAAPRLFPADAGRRGADQVGDVGMGGGLAGFEVFRGEPAVFVGGGPLPLVHAVEAHRGGADGDRVEGLVLGYPVTAPGELDRVLGDGLAQALGLDRDAGLLVQFPGARVAQRLTWIGRAADREPERTLGMMRIPAVQQQDAPLVVHRQHPGGLAVDDGAGRGHVVRLGHGHGYPTILEMGISSMSWAPAAFRAGISVLTPRLGTTVSTACMFPRASVVIVGEDRAGSMSVTAASLSAATLSFSRTLPRAWIAPRSSRAMSSMAARFSASANAGGDAISSV